MGVGGFEHDTFRDLNFRQRSSFDVHECRILVVEEGLVRLPTSSLADDGDDGDDGSIIHINMATSRSNRLGMGIAIVANKDNFCCNVLGE